MTGTVTRSANSKGFRFSRADLGGDTTRRVLVGFFLGFCWFCFFSSTVIFQLNIKLERKLGTESESSFGGRFLSPWVRSGKEFAGKRCRVEDGH